MWAEASVWRLGGTISVLMMKKKQFTSILQLED
jgi:hypothetical protein